MTVLTSRILEETGIVRFACSTRQGGVSKPPFGMNLSYKVGDDPASVDENRRILLRHLGATPADLALPGQVHSAIVRRADRPGLYGGCDALITAREGVVLGVSVADCVPVFLVDPLVRVVAAVHAGWRGTAANIVGATVSTLSREYGCGARDLVAFIGPSAGVCCYVVGEEVAALFPPQVMTRVDRKSHVDLKAANLHQLLEAGMSSARVEVSPHCTISEEALFHSYRRDRERSGRMMGVIRLVPSAIR